MGLLASQVKEGHWQHCRLIQAGKEWMYLLVEVFVKYLQNAKSAA